MEEAVENYELAVMEWMSGQPHLTSHPKKNTLIYIATHTSGNASRIVLSVVSPMAHLLS
jgi:hypothetical protein